MTLRTALKHARGAVHLERQGPDYLLHYQQDGTTHTWPMHASGYRAANVARSIAVLEAAAALLRGVEAIRLGLYWTTLPQVVTGIGSEIEFTNTVKPIRSKKDRSARRHHNQHK